MPKVQRRVEVPYCLRLSERILPQRPLQSSDALSNCFSYDVCAHPISDDCLTYLLSYQETHRRTIMLAWASSQRRPRVALGAILFWTVPILFVIFVAVFMAYLSHRGWTRSRGCGLPAGFVLGVVVVSILAALIINPKLVLDGVSWPQFHVDGSGCVTETELDLYIAPRENWLIAFCVIVSVLLVV